MAETGQSVQDILDLKPGESIHQTDDFWVQRRVPDPRYGDDQTAVTYPFQFIKRYREGKLWVEMSEDLVRDGAFDAWDYAEHRLDEGARQSGGHSTGGVKV